MKWRERAMTSASLSAKSRGLSLYLHTLKSSIGLMVAFFLLLFLSGPLPFISQSLNLLARRRLNAVEEVYYSSSFSGTYSSENFVFFLLITIIAAFVVGLIASSFMHNRQAVDVFGALPVKRERLLFSKLAGGITILFIPYLLNAVILFAAQGILQAYDNSWMHWTVDLASYFVYAVAIIAITVFCAVNTGTVFDTAIFALTMCGAPSIVLLLNRFFLSIALIGYTSTSWLDDFIIAISPIASPFRRLFVGWNSTPDHSYTITSLVIWPVAIALIILCTLFLFRRRDNELAGISRPSGTMQLITKLLVADIAGILISLLFSQTIANNWISASAGFLLGAFVAYFIAEAILARGFKTFGRMLLQFAGAAVVVLLYTGILYSGGFGYAKRVPDPERVQTVEISYGGSGDTSYGKYLPYHYYQQENDSSYSDPQIIAQVVSAHRAITQGEGFKGINDNDYNSASLAQKGLLQTSTDITYTLKNGRTITRYFSKTPIEAREELYALDGIEEFRVRNDLSAFLRAKDIVSVSRNDMTLEQEPTATSLTQQQAEALLGALERDAAATTQQQLHSPAERELFTLQINLHFSYENTNVAVPENSMTGPVEENVTKRIFSWNKNTLDVLRGLGWQINTEPDTSGIAGAYLVGYGSYQWVNSPGYSGEQFGGIVHASRYSVTTQELYLSMMEQVDIAHAEYAKEYAYTTEGTQLTDEMVEFLSSRRFSDPVQIAQLVQASVSSHLVQPGEKFYTVAFENAASQRLNGNIAQVTTIYIIPEHRAPEFLKSMQPIL